VHASAVVGWAPADPLPLPVLLRHQAPEVWARCRELSTGGLARRVLSHRVDACTLPPALHAPSPEPGSGACVCPLVAWTCAPKLFVCLACPSLAKSASVCPALVPTVPPLRLRVLCVLVCSGRCCGAPVAAGLLPVGRCLCPCSRWRLVRPPVVCVCLDPLCVRALDVL